MNKQQTIQSLSKNKTVLTQRFGVTRLALFGSTARDAATADSDVDILVSFDGVATSQRYFGVQFYLEDLLGCTVDLVTEKALRAELRPYIEREAIDIWFTAARVAFLHYRYVAFAENVISYTDGFDQERFVNSGITYDATLRNLELIGEAATHIPQEIREMYNQVQWRLIIATRNKLIHGYLGIDNDTLWSIIQTDVPELLSQLQQFK